jgi:uncharacterized membrane protein
MLKYSVIVCYTACLFILCTVDLLSYPGYPSEDYDYWYRTTDRYVYYTSKSLWSFLNLVSGTLAVIGILQIVATVRQLNFSNPTLKQNTQAMILHMTLIALQALVIVLITLPSDIYSAKFYKI